MRVLRWTGMQSVFVPALGVVVPAGTEVEIDDDNLAEEIRRDTAGWNDVSKGPAETEGVPEGEE